MKKDGVELYLSKDIVQGEEVPFYLVWTDPNLRKFKVNLNGFDSISEYYNLKPEEIENVIKDHTINWEQLKQNFYFGGTLKTTKTDIPFKNAKMEVICDLSDGSQITLLENRTLFTTFIELKQNHSTIKYPDQNSLLDIGLKGSTTVFINIENSPDSEIKLVLPKDIQTAFEKFIYSLMKGLKDLKTKYPEYSEFLDFLLNPIDKKENLSERQFTDKVESIANNFKPTDKFRRDLGIVFYNAANIESDMFNHVIRPLIEYFESSAAKNSFLDQPFLSVLIPKGVGIFKGKIYYQDLIERKKSSSITHPDRENFIDFEMIVESDEEYLVPIKEAINIRRIQNGSN